MEDFDPWAASNRPPNTFPLTCGGRVIGYAEGLANGNISATVTDMATARALSGPRVQVSVDMRILPDE